MKKTILLCLVAAQTTYANPAVEKKILICSSPSTQSESLEITSVNNQVESFREISTLPFSQTQVKGQKTLIKTANLRKDGSIDFEVAQYYTLIHTAVVDLPSNKVVVETYDKDDGELSSETLLCSVEVK